ncbi:MAG: type VI secretion system contractile sheath small subunit [Pseudomonadota bacterium]
MSESKQKVIERNRPPRVQIAYDVEHYGSPTTIELPFVMGVMADLGGDSETKEATKPLNDRNFVDVDAQRFSKFMEALSPRVKARVKNTLPATDGAESEDELFVDLSFQNMGDFTPDKVAQQVPALAELLKMRGQLEELLGFIDGKVSAEKRIADLLANQPLLQQAAEAAVTEGVADGEDG